MRDSSRTFVITEGLLLYLRPDDMVALGRDLHATGAEFWLTDLVSPQLLKWMQRSWDKNTTNANAEFRFAPAEGTGFFDPLG